MSVQKADPQAPDVVVIDPSQVFTVDSVAGSAPQALPQFENEGGAREFLSTEHFPQGLQDAYVESLTKVPIRYYIIDDSGSMCMDDGKRVHVTNGKKSMVKCSRWAELTDAMRFHINFARQAAAPTEFRLLNGGLPFKIGYNDPDEPTRLRDLMASLSNGPGGGTPLCKHIREVTAQIEEVAPLLRAKGQKACVVIATDGMSSDGDVAQAMAPLKNLPVWVVLRLCTDDEGVGKYWNAVDEQLELNMDVLDDLSGEAQEVHEKNPWLTYGEKIQRLREFGIVVKELDLLDERKLSFEELRRTVKTLFGGKLEDYPHPEIEFDAFLHAVEARNAAAGTTWDPVSRKDKPWVDLRRLKSAYGKHGCIIT